MTTENSSALQSEPVLSQAETGLRDIATRLAELLEQENAALRAHQTIDLDENSDRKNQMLLELSRISRTLDGGPPDPALRPVLDRLRDRLDENLAVLDLNIGAVRDVAGILTSAIREAESDGTYSTLTPLRDIG